MAYDFKNRSSKRMDRELLGHTIAFLKHLDSRLAPDCLTYTVTEQDVADFFGSAIGILRIALALNQLAQMRFEAENSLEWIICSLINTCAFKKEQKEIYIAFAREGRIILRTLDVDRILDHLH
jgi:hypothetical protein